ncbi:MAG: hypothetical protein ACR2NM_07035, partial [Bythopirellula sp.]
SFMPATSISNLKGSFESGPSLSGVLVFLGGDSNPMRRMAANRQIRVVSRNLALNYSHGERV